MASVDTPAGMRYKATTCMAEFRHLFRAGAWALTTIWKTNRAAALTLGGVAVVFGLLPGALALTTRGLINAAAGVVQGGGDALQPLLPWLVLGFVVTVVEAVGPLAIKVLLQRLTDDVNLEVTSDVLRHAAALDLGSLENPALRNTIESAQEDTASMFARLLTHVMTISIDTVQIALMVVILTYLEPLVLAVVCPFALPYLIVRWRTAKLRTSEDLEWTTKRRWTRYFVLHLTGQRAATETKLLGLGPLFLAKFRALMTQFRDRDVARSYRDFRNGSLFAVLTTLSLYLLFVRVALSVGQGTLTIGDIAVFAAVSGRLRLTIERLIWSVSSMSEGAAWIANLRTFLATPSRMPTNGNTLPATRRGEVELRDVSFSYSAASAPAVSDVSLRIEPGEVLAIVGENGAGKTTLVRLIARLYDPDRGSVRLDGIDLKDWPIDELHRSVAFLDQRFAQYEATAADNVAYGDWKGLLGQRDRVQQVATAAGVDDLIRAMPHGYETVLGPLFGTHDLSAGQWQKLAAARALARDASILIVDEPTAHLDAAAEYELFCRLREVARGRTTILVSHRFTTLGLADRIVAMEGGRVVESGSHAELLARGGVYARLYDLHRRQSSRDG